ncbi:MAG: response regulator [Desulfobacterales bacterium]|nr:response regulator [Desulfobacterales bacterium]
MENETDTVLNQHNELDRGLLLSVLRTFRRGDFSVRLPDNISGPEGEIAALFNDIAHNNQVMVKEIARVAKVVGTNGKISERAALGALPGAWNQGLISVNKLVGALALPLSEINDVISSVAKGKLDTEMALEIEGTRRKGAFLQTCKSTNAMVENLREFASEVTRVAREVGTEGKLGGQAKTKGLSGTWRDITGNVNMMASNLTEQVRNIADITTSVANGDLSKKITVEAQGEIQDLKDTINTMVAQLNSFASEVTRVARAVGTDGILGDQAKVEGASGIWRDLTDNVNVMAINLTNQVRNIAEVTTAVANGDLSRKIEVEASGEILELSNIINTMVEQLRSFADEVTRVAREVGTEGKLGGQAEVKGISGTWKDLTENVNIMAINLTGQVRSIAEITTAVANGDLSKKIEVEASGEILELRNTINTMVDQLGSFAAEVTRVAREVGIEGKLGAQAKAPGAAGIWRDLTDNVNELAANLTTQVRAIAEVARAVTEGDLTRSIKAEARGEVATLKDNINEMILNLKNTTTLNQEQDWLKTNLAQFASMLQGQRDLLRFGNMILSELAPLVTAQHGVFYIAEQSETETKLKLLSSYAFKQRKQLASEFRLGEGLVGQCALEKQRILITEVPDDYVQINSGLGKGTPLNIVVLPIIFEDELQAVIELASFNRFSDISITFLDQLTENIGVMLNTIAATMRTEELLKESQSMAEELQNQQDELKQTNEELEEQTFQLASQKQAVEEKNKEVEFAKISLEEKAEELTLTSKYKSEFLANMSHELRTPLNSQLILSSLLAENEEGNLSEKQVEYAETINASGKELLGLINEVLDLSKVESGSMTIDIADIYFSDLKSWAEKSFSGVAGEGQLHYRVELDEKLPPAMHSDEKRIQQILRNLLSNAFKFTDKGRVDLAFQMARTGWSHLHEALNSAEGVVALKVSDSGIGIPENKQRVIFEAFQQADGTTSRKYGGTGLGLSITREITRLLGGEIQVRSVVGKGSTFTVYLPLAYIPVEEKAHGGEFRRLPVHPPPAPKRKQASKSIEDDRSSIEEDDQIVLIVEDDPVFSKLLAETARARGFKTLVTDRGKDAVELAREFVPDAITLDLNLPDMIGITVLDMLKRHMATRHIPVHIISVEEETPLTYKMGAISHFQKPLTQKQLSEKFYELEKSLHTEMRKLLVVEDDETQQESIRELIGNGDVKVIGVRTGSAALDSLEKDRFDCIVLDLGLPDMSGFDLIGKINKNPRSRHTPIIVYTGKELTKEQEVQLKRVAQTIIIKDVKAMDRLLDETALFLHRVVEKLPEKKRQMLEKLQLKDPGLTGKKVLVVDDDLRNVFAITAILEQQDMVVKYAESGIDGIKILRQNPDTDIVLMDIMMPEMDGYQAIAEIRKKDEFKPLPIIALTAKAMKGDREKCLNAGASDYISKPVKKEQLLSLIRVWLSR